MFLIGFAVTLLGLAFWALLLGGYMLNFIDIISFSIILCPLLGVLTATRSFKVFYLGLKAAIFPKSEISEDIRGRAASLFRLLSKTVAIVAVIAVLICMRNILYVADFSNIDGLYGLGRNLTCAFMSPLYAMLLATAVFEPVVFILKKRQLKAAHNPPRALRD